MQKKKLPRGCQSGHRSQNSSPLMSYLQLQAWLSSLPEKPQQNKSTVSLKLLLHGSKNLIVFGPETFATVGI